MQLEMADLQCLDQLSKWQEFKVIICILVICDILTFPVGKILYLLKLYKLSRIVKIFLIFFLFTCLYIFMCECVYTCMPAMVCVGVCMKR